MEGKRLKDLRKSKGLTQRKLAELLNVESSAVGKWEIHNITPSVDTLKRLCEIFNVSVNYLLGIDTEASTPVQANTITITDQNGNIINYELTEDNLQLLTPLIEKLAKRE